jgi:hypothetical protein
LIEEIPMRTCKHLLFTFGALAMFACGGGNNASGPDGGAGGCDLVGTWMVPGGGTATYAVKSDGTTQLSLGTQGTVTGTWSLSGSRLSLTDTAATGIGAGQKCDAGVVGQYDLAFATSCNAVTMTLVSDACSMRATAVNGATMTR